MTRKNCALPHFRAFDIAASKADRSNVSARQIPSGLTVALPSQMGHCHRGRLRDRPWFGAASTQTLDAVRLISPALSHVGTDDALQHPVGEGWRSRNFRSGLAAAAADEPLIG